MGNAEYMGDKRRTNVSLRIADFEFAARHILNGVHDLVAVGTSHLRYWSFPVCAAVLYMPKRYSNNPQVVTSAAVPKVLELRYLRSISSDAFRKSTRDCIKANG